MNTKNKSPYWDMRPLKLILLLMLFVFGLNVFLNQSAYASNQKQKPKQSATGMAESDVSKIADAIYKIEGGAKAKSPYGILSVKVANEAEARRVCMNTIKNNYKRWRDANSHQNYFDFLANRYCPESADPVGNARWKKNIRATLGSDMITKYAH